MKLPYRLIGFFAAVSLIAFVAYKFGDEFLLALTRLPVLDMIALYSAIIAIIFFGCFRWWLLLRAHGVEVRLGRALEAGWVAQAINVLTPAGISGDLFKIVLVRDSTVYTRKRDLLGTIALDRVIGLLGLIATILVAVAASSQDVTGGLEFGNVWLVLLLVLGGCLALAGFLLADRLLGGEDTYLGRKLKAVADIVRTMLQLMRHFWLMAGTVLLTLIGNLLLSFALWRILSAFGEVSFGIVLLLVTLSFLISLVPVTINGLGTRDMVFAMILTPLGFAPEESLTASLLCFAAVTLTSVVGGAAAWLHMNGMSNPLTWIRGHEMVEEPLVREPFRKEKP